MPMSAQAQRDRAGRRSISWNVIADRARRPAPRRIRTGRSRRRPSRRRGSCRTARATAPSRAAASGRTGRTTPVSTSTFSALTVPPTPPWPISCETPGTFRATARPADLPAVTGAPIHRRSSDRPRTLPAPDICRRWPDSAEVFRSGGFGNLLLVRPAFGVRRGRLRYAGAPSCGGLIGGLEQDVVEADVRRPGHDVTDDVGDVLAGQRRHPRIDRSAESWSPRRT